LEKTLTDCGIAYEWHGKALGGMRPSYAEHMQTEEFQTAAAALAARKERVCLMCAESNPADCHRFHIADWLVAKGERVMHLVDIGKQQEHPARLV
jgi:uncharacterized protein (DUF488 family)